MSTARSRAGNDVGGSESEIVELVPGERIVLHWQFVGPDRTTDPALEPRLTVTFTATPDGTQLDLTHGRLVRSALPTIPTDIVGICPTYPQRLRSE